MDDDRDFNPYAPPKAQLKPPEPETPPGVWRDAPRRVPAVNGLLWWRQAARIVAARPGRWTAALCLVAAVPTVLAAIGLDLDGDDDGEEIFFMLSCLFLFFWPVLTGGIVNAAHKQLQGERMRLRDIFAFSLGWGCVGFFVTPLVILVFSWLFLALEALPLTSETAPALACAPMSLVTGIMFIAAAAALHGDWPVRVIFRAGLVNMPAFLFNLLAVTLATLAICAVPLLVARIVPSRLTQALTVQEEALVFTGALSLAICAAFGALALVAYAAVRDIFYNEE